MTTPSYSRSSLNPTYTASSPTTGNGRLSSVGNTVCLGHGLDASVDGLLATIVLFGLIGLLLWVCCIPLSASTTSYVFQLLFAFIRPRCRQIYGLREWFVQERCVRSAYLTVVLLSPQRFRPARLSSTFWAFLRPLVPMVPSISKVPSDPGDPAAADARTFPSDEELSQRTLWCCFLVVLGWSILGLIGALPLYMISVPCLAETAPPPHFLGRYSTLQDLSVLRVLQLFDNRNVNGQDLKSRARVRAIILSGLLIGVGLVPALVKILHEYSKLVAFRRKWTDVHLQGKEMGWISARRAPGLASWGEKRLKDFILKNGLSSSLDFSAEPANSGVSRRERSRRHGHRSPYMYSEDDDLGLEVDILSLFTIVYVSRPEIILETDKSLVQRYATSCPAHRGARRNLGAARASGD